MYNKSMFLFTELNKITRAIDAILEFVTAKNVAITMQATILMNLN